MYDFLRWLCQPYTLLLLMMAWGLVWARRRHPGGTRPFLICMVAYALLVGASLPCVSHLLFLVIESPYSPLDVTPQPSDTIVVLTGAILRTDRVRRYDELAESSFYRCHHAAHLYRQGRCTILVSGGKVDPSEPGSPAAEVMHDYLLELGIDRGDVSVETQSRSTHESARECRKRIGDSPQGRLILVTDAAHMSRSMAAFQAQGLRPLPAPCNPRATEFRWSWQKFVPNPRALASVHTATHELTGMVWYWLKGRF
jgi:uncharacterized SAM-binding protein YcdF (DUF218 family)